MDASQHDPVHFLLVDDEEESLSALEALLRREGLLLLKARSGHEALDLLLTHDVALALIDTEMPVMDGFELAELMRSTECAHRVPIIFLSTDSGDRQRDFKVYETGAVDLLCKHVEPHIIKMKAEVFFELYRQRQEVVRQRDELRRSAQENARLLEETCRYADALQQADRRKDEFLATLAHELRNPLAPLRTGLHILRHSQTDSPMGVRTREMMERQLSHLVRLVDDLLDVSRITSGNIVLKRRRVSVRSVVELAVEATTPLIQSLHHALSVAHPLEEIYVHADYTRLAQVVGNLLNNAAKYTLEGGKIDVVVEQVANQVVVKVTDTGVGIDTDMLPRVFDMFTQVGRTLGRSQGGLGIGLSLVKRLVEKHGGWVSATSNGLGSGSTFAIWLPTCDGPAKNMEDATAVDTQPCRQPLRILVVDDNADAAESLSMIFQLDGHEVSSAGTGPEAISAALRVSPHVIFLDIGLPGMNGYEVARAIRAELGASAPVLVALTGWGSEDDKRKSKEAGFDYHLTKPVDVDRVGDLLRKVDCNKVATGVRVDGNQETDASTHHLLNTPLVCE